ncbi:M20 family metallo-hydrolase [Sulfuracidifex metallicus]|uniref:Hydantoinase/carbamoylase family amidase n=2 Tax=Sulfuracidifex metallicus TaxID=47303 RepID=A0A6A9QPI5_SULME|nr:M20 family metallo-hydrolase [Sulfuracidifex metallicus]MUN29101.1 hydantoinase/carbamoylase family amidase [Sulfuracidifex metallicus DSM 6482 = JCM 9184]WOE50382.1 M20 family metallo-hydrolase [Sulfuracidifex metallicus DSM 6482 = JCM 9184]
MNRIREDIEALGKIGKDNRGGNSRPALTYQDLEARKHVVDIMKDAGLRVLVDKGANIIGIREGKLKEPFVSTGSHIDTVMNGGMFDGVLGVMGGLETIRQMNEERIKTDFPLALIVFTDEEGNSFMPFAGSKFFTGEINEEELGKLRGKYEDISFRDTFKRFIEKVEGKVELIDRFPFKVKTHMELHVEQGPILDAKKIQIGVVNGIVGVERLWINFLGKQSHAGSTPMNMRADPLIPASETVLKVRQTVGEFNEMVGTVGFLEVSPNVVNVISGKVRLGIDIRSLSEKDMEDATTKIMKGAENSSLMEGVRMETERLVEKPVPCSPKVIGEIKSSAEELGYSYLIMPSRAIHDTQVMASITDVGMIFVPSKDGISHAPQEWTDWEDCDRGQRVLKLALLKELQNK